MISAWIILIFVLLGALAIGLVGVGLYFWFKEEEHLGDENLIINCMPQHTLPEKGFSIGSEISCDNIDNKNLITFKPKDVDIKKYKKFDRIMPVKIVADKNKVVTLPKGTLSNNRNIKIILPPNPEDFPTSLKETEFGKLLMCMTEQINVNNVESAVIREGSDRKTNILTKSGDGEISIDYLQTQSELFTDAMKTVTEVKNKSTSTTSLHSNT